MSQVITPTPAKITKVRLICNPPKAILIRMICNPPKDVLNLAENKKLRKKKQMKKKKKAKIIETVFAHNPSPSPFV